MAKDMRGLEVGQRERLTTTQTDILTVRGPRAPVDRRVFRILPIFCP